MKRYLIILGILCCFISNSMAQNYGGSIQYYKNRAVKGAKMTMGSSQILTYYKNGNRKNENIHSNCDNITKPTITGNHTICFGDSGLLTCTTLNQKYKWSNGDTTRIIKVKTSGSYKVSVTYSGGCKNESVPFTVTMLPAIAAPSVANGAISICAGSSTNLNATSSGNTIRWYSTSTGGAILGTTNSGENYSVTPANTSTFYAEAYSSAGCSSPTRSGVVVAVNHVTAPNVSISNTSICSGSTANLTATGCLGTVLWSNSSTGSIIVVNTTGTYTATCTDTENGCTSIASNSVSLNVNPNPTASTVGSNSPVCEGNTLNLSASGGTSYTWSGANSFSSTQQNPSILNTSTLESGSYQVTVSDVNGCTASASIVITVNPNPTAPAASSNSPLCEGTTLNLSASGGTSYMWSGANSFSSTQQNPSIINPTSGTYVVTIADGNGCTASSSILVTVNPNPTITVSSNSPICVGATLNLFATGGTNYTWSGANSFSSTQQNPSISNVSILATGTYQVTITDGNGCTATAPTVVTVNPNPAATTSSNSPICEGNTLGLSASGGTRYTWSGANSFSSTEQNPSISNVSTLATGTYAVTVMDGNGCTSTNTTGVIINPKPTATASSNSTICEGNTLYLSATGGTSYVWSGLNSFSSTSQYPSINSATTLASGTYQVTITDGNGCTAIATTVVTVNPKPTVTVSSNSPICSGSTLNLSATGGTSYTWSGANSFNSIQQNPNVANAAIAASGTYQVTVTDMNGCISTATTGAIVNPNPTITVSSNSPICAGNTLNLSASGGTSYLWSGVNSFSSTQQNPSITNLTALASGTYQVTITNENGCTASASTTVTVNPKPTIIVSSNSPICASATLNLSASGGVSYIWSGANSFSSIQQNPNITNATTLASGTYTLTVSDGNSCMATVTTVVTINPKPTATASSNSPICVGSTLNLSATGGVNYTWSGINSLSSTQQNPSISNVSNLLSGTYHVTVSDGNGCSATATTVVAVNPKPTVTVSSNSPICAGSTLNIFASGDITTYTWIGANSFSSAQQNPSITNVSTLASGTYQVTVTDANGCTASASTTITVNPNPTITVSSNSPICAGNTLNLSASGGTSYLWSGVNSFSSTEQSPNISSVTSSNAGVYTVTIIDSNGCVSSTTTSVIIYPTPTVTVSSNSPVCVGRTLNLSANGGISYVWSGVNSFASTQQNPSVNAINNSYTGTYRVVISDANGCTATATISVIINSNPTVSATSNSPICEKATLNLSVSSGTSYVWTGSNQFSSTAQNPSIVNSSTTSSGIYQVTVTDANGCTATATTNVLINPIPSVTLNSNSPVCEGTTLNLLASGGTNYIWTGPDSYSSTQQNPSITNATTTASGTYTITVSNANGCTASASILVTVTPNPLIPTVNSNNFSICSGKTITVNATSNSSIIRWYRVPTGGTIISTSNSSADHVLTPSNTLDYYAEAYSPTTGCASASRTLVSVFVDNLGASISTNFPVCANGELDLHGNANALNCLYQWNGPNGFSSTEQNPVITTPSTNATGIYTLTVTNLMGCTATTFQTVTIRSITANINSTNVTCLNVADGSATIVASSPSGTLSYKWSTGATSVGVSNLSAGTYSVKVSDSFGCSITSSVTISITNPSPTNTITVQNINNLCSGGNVTLTASANSSYLWNTGATTQSITTNVAGDYWVTVTNLFGCSATSLPTTITGTPPTPVTVSGGGTFCNSAILTATGGIAGAIYWQGKNSGGTSRDTLSSSQVVSKSGTYYFRAYNGCGWGTEGSVTVTINTIPAPVTVNGGGTFCNFGTITASGGSGGTIYYQGLDIGGTSLAKPTTSVSINYSSSGVYHFRSHNTCGWGEEGSTSLTINFKPNTVIVSGHGRFCNSATLTASGGYGGTIYYQGIVSGGTAMTSPVSSQVLYQSGTYYFRAYNSCGWGTQGGTNVEVVTPPSAITVSGGGTYCNTATLTATGCIGTVLWSNAATGSSISVTSNGTYTASCRWNADNCPNLISNAVSVSFVPNSLTLNGTATSGEQNAKQTISSIQTILPNSTVNYKAGKSISLHGTFEAKQGSVFTAGIKPCND